ncbi:hypothetical protein ACXXDK_17895 (plasmid) [Deinococcus sp. PESE-38]
MRYARDTEGELRRLLGESGVATTAQLERRGLLATAETLDLPSLTLDLTLTGAGSSRPVTCVSPNPASVDLRRTSARQIGHEIAATELLDRRPGRPDQVWIPAPVSAQAGTRSPTCC